MIPRASDRDDPGADVAEVAGLAGGSGYPQGIQSVEVAMTVLLAMEAGAGPMSLSQIAACSRLQPGKVHRYLVSLSRVGLVAQSPTSGLYDLGPALRRLGAEALRRMDEVGLASEHLPGLRDRTRHSVNLAVWGDHGPVIVRWDYGAYPLPITVRVGATMPLFTSAVGQVFLAYLPETLTAPVLAAQRDLEDPKAPTDKEIERAKAIVRRDGVAFTSGGLIPGLASVAAPVFTTAASLPLVVAIALPRPQAAPAVLHSLSADLLATTRAISAELGYAQNLPATPGR
ncbi:MAG TPA: IclR family transcriptional regulator [Streptosporangiaceae bacterium]|nr:IclR family transcriptional regulator [Streptosporangiaceae bacterium]